MLKCIQVETSCQGKRLVLCASGRPLGVTDISAEVVTLVSHATQEYLRGLLEKVTVIAEHRKTVTKVQRHLGTQCTFTIITHICLFKSQLLALKAGRQSANKWQW